MTITPEQRAALDWLMALPVDSELHNTAVALLKLLRPSRTMPEAMVIVWQILAQSAK